MLFKNPILKDAVIARRVRARAFARSKRIEFASLFPPKTCFQVGKRKRRAGHDWFANRQERGRKTGKIRSYNAPLPPSSCPFTHRMFSTWWLVVHVIAPSCSSSRFRCADPMSPTRCHVDECARELSRINTYGNERKRADRSFRGFGPRTRGLRVDFQREDWKGFWMVDR